MWPNPQFPADLVKFIEETLNGKLHFLCSESSILDAWQGFEYTFFIIHFGHAFTHKTKILLFGVSSIFNIFNSVILSTFINSIFYLNAFKIIIPVWKNSRTHFSLYRVGGKVSWTLLKVESSTDIL